jgi:hypothetical protein
MWVFVEDVRIGARGTFDKVCILSKRRNAAAYDR